MGISMIEQNWLWLNPSAVRIAFIFSDMIIDMVPTYDLAFTQLVHKSEPVEPYLQPPI